MKTIFLSAGIPELVDNRKKEYFETADRIAIRDAILALVYVCLKLDIKIVWGGHPKITPIIYEAIRAFEEKELHYSKRLTDALLKTYIQKHVHLFQSEYFRDRFPKDNNKFENVTITKKKNDISDSIHYMREEMLSYQPLSAAIYIGGMEGIREEDEMFIKRYPNTPTFPIASTGGAAYELYVCKKTDRDLSDDLIENYAYTSLFYSILGNL